ncbi:DUF4190 domain-containing protein [Sinomonas sp. R1AF57]|uniref:MmpS family transport accessory protein n=1 Tax=Sinomonas sp. R1AF57 TaxID=2020377 RepID=UPI000B5FB976|nr:DUF4190 domain-containing protein [Sinomonas sp. R1AF57]ASN52802.1 hypothetical protein CGQ25_12475 [Sinomonas sp. R1AF57]
MSRPTSTLAIIALVLGALALIFSFIPLVNFVAFALAIASIVCAVVSLIRRSGGKSMAIIGLALSVVAFISAIVVNIVVATAISSASQAISKGLETYSAQASAKHTIEYKVTTNAPATVHYWAPDGTGQTDVSADWTKDISSTGFTSALVSVNSSDYKNTAAAVSCEIIIDGKSVAKNTGSGASASASCNATAD